MKYSTKSMIPALLAVGGGLAAAPASAIELGEISVQSALGQPLRASIAYALAPNENIASYCVSLNPGATSDGLPAVNGATLTVGNGVILLTGKSAIHEPLMSVRLNIRCPYTPYISREYLLFIDPAQVVAAPSTTVAAPVSTAQPGVAANTVPAAKTTINTAPANQTPIDSRMRYRVQPGDSLSLIAQRIENRPVGLWSAVAQIFETNPNAFIDNDPNRLKAGSWLVMPDFVGQAAFAESSDEVSQVTPVAISQESASSLYEGISTGAVVDEVATPEPAASVVEAVREEPFAAVADELVEIVPDDTSVLEPASAPSTVEQQPADVILDVDLEAPTTAVNANVPVARIVTAEPPSQSGINWLLWLVGGGIALIAGLFLFGRRGRGSQTPEPEEAQHPHRRSADGNTEELASAPGVDFDLTDDSPTHENLILDADLIIGAGLDKATDMDVAQDFGFAVTTHLDLELPEETGKSHGKDGTDIIAPLHIDEDSILNSEVLPEDDDYDMSVIIDATKMPVPEEVTERDLKAVVVGDGGETLISGDYTISKEVDYDIVQQDYEDELTATQALNMEIEKAAADIANRMEKEEAPDPSNDLTTELPLASVTAIDVTANLPAGNDDQMGDDDDTGLNIELTEEMVADEKTVEMPASGKDSKAG